MRGGVLEASWDNIKSQSLRDSILLGEELEVALGRAEFGERVYLYIAGNEVKDTRTGGIYLCEPVKGDLAGKGKKYPVWMNVNRKMSSLLYGFTPLSKEQAISHLGEVEGAKYYEDWWTQW